MNKVFAEYMTFGKTVESLYTSETFKLVGDMDPETGEVEAVSTKDYPRWKLLNAWLKNGVAERDCRVEEYRAEAESMIETLKHDAIRPNDKVRFVSTSYETLFEVMDLGSVKIDGKIRKVNYIDECHFAFLGGCCYHIMEFAELCEKNHIKVDPLQKDQM